MFIERVTFTTRVLHVFSVNDKFMLVKTLYFYEFYETVDITTLEKSYNFVTIINRHFYRQLFPSVM